MHGRRLLAQMTKSQAAHASTVRSKSKEPIIVSNLEEWEECEEGDPDCEDVLVPVDVMQSEEYVDEEDEVLTENISPLYGVLMGLYRTLPRFVLSTLNRANEYDILMWFIVILQFDTEDSYSISYEEEEEEEIEDIEDAQVLRYIIYAMFAHSR